MTPVTDALTWLTVHSTIGRIYSPMLFNTRYLQQGRVRCAISLTADGTDIDHVLCQFDPERIGECA